MTRIELTDTIVDTVTKMSGGNPGALTVCMEILEHGALIDPDNVLGEVGILMSLDMNGIYEERIWMFYKDVCHGDLPMMIAVNRACQLGIVARGVLNHAIDNYGDGIDVDDLIRQVEERLPAFVIVPDENLIRA